MANRWLGKAAAAVAAFILMVSTASCSGGGSAGPNASATADSGTPDGGKKIKLTLYYQYDDNAMAAEAINFRDTIREFREARPDVEFTAENISPSIYWTKIQTLAASNELPDIFPALPSMQQTYSRNGLIADLTPIFERDAEWKDGFIPGAFDDQTYAGRIFGVPYESLVSTVLYWNKGIFAKSGIDGFPRNLDEFKVAIRKLKAAGYIPMAMGNKNKDPLASTFMPGLVFRFVDKEWYDSVREGTGAKFTDPEYVKAIDMLGELIRLGLFNEDMNLLDGRQALESYYAKGKAGMFVTGSWAISGMINGMPRDVLDQTEFATMPPQAAKPELGSLAPGGTGWGYVVNAQVTGERLEAAVEFLKMLTSKKAGEKIINSGSLTAIQAAPKDPSKLPPFFVKFLEFRKQAEPAPVPEIQLSASFMEASYSGYQAFSVGRLTSRQLAEKLQAAMEEAFRS